MSQISTRASNHGLNNQRPQRLDRRETEFESRLKARYDVYAADDSFPSFLETLYFNSDYTSRARRAR